MSSARQLLSGDFSMMLPAGKPGRTIHSGDGHVLRLLHLCCSSTVCSVSYDTTARQLPLLYRELLFLLMPNLRIHLHVPWASKRC